jgi:hypothetical protein
LSQPIELIGLGPGDQLEIDGQPQAQAASAPSVRLAEGLHHLRVLRAGRAVFATFSEIAPGQAALQLPVPQLVPCSAADLASVRPDDTARGRPPPPGIACTSWALVRPEARGVAVALCSGSRCGSFVSWEKRPPPAFAPLGVDRPGLPAWATFTAAAAAGVLTTSLLLWQAGAFDGAQRSPRFGYGGLNP